MPPLMDTLQGMEAILLVEDDNAVRTLLSRALQARGDRLLVARNGEDALEVADQHRGTIPLVISDIVMPRMPPTSFRLDRLAREGRALLDSDPPRGAQVETLPS
jgi:CheY-like chemotaxis protein